MRGRRNEKEGEEGGGRKKKGIVKNEEEGEGSIDKVREERTRRRMEC